MFHQCPCCNLEYRLISKKGEGTFSEVLQVSLQSLSLAEPLLVALPPVFKFLFKTRHIGTKRRDWKELCCQVHEGVSSDIV